MTRLLFMLLLLVASGSWADCRVSTVNAAFGSVTSFALSGSGEVATTGTLVVACDALVNLLTGDTITLNFVSATVSANGRATMKRTDNAAITDVIPTRLCGQSGCANNSEVQTSKTYTWDSSTLLNLIGGKQYNIPLYFRTVPGQNVTAGPYQVTLNFDITYRVCSVGVLNACLSGLQTGTKGTSITLDMTVTNDCSAMTTPDVNFNSAPLVQSFPTVSQAIAVTCTKGSTYTIGINNGANATSRDRKSVV